MSYLLLIGGIALLLLGGDFLVRGAVGLAERIGIPPIIIGLTIVAFGTSAPELVVSLKAAVSGAPGIAVGNVVGSNIANILLVVGLPAVIAATDCNQTDIIRNAVYVLGASILFIALSHIGPLGVWHGAILFTLMVLFLVETGRRAVSHRSSARASLSSAAAAGNCADVEEIDGVSGAPHALPMIGMFIIAGLVALPAGGHLTVDAARDLALRWGMSEAVVGLTVVALGTSLPELATTLVAAVRGHCGLALGNVLGSNLFNILAIMGIVSVVTPIPVPQQMLDFDLWVMLAATLLVMPFAITRTKVTRLPGALFFLGYIAYIAFAVSSNGTAFAGTF